MSGFPRRAIPGATGPELSMMGPLHPPEFFAESIINPSAIVERGRGYAAADGSSKMPSYAESLTVQETIDLVAYLRQLRPPAASSSGAAGHAGHPGQHDPLRRRPDGLRRPSTGAPARLAHAHEGDVEVVRLVKQEELEPRRHVHLSERRVEARARGLGR